MNIRSYHCFQVSKPIRTLLRWQHLRDSQLPRPRLVQGGTRSWPTNLRGSWSRLAAVSLYSKSKAFLTCSIRLVASLKSEDLSKRQMLFSSPSFTMVYKLHSSLVAEPQNWKALGNLLPVLVNILLFLWDLPEDVPKPKPAETELRPRPRGRGRGTETKKEKGQVAPKVAASPPKAWHCIFWFLTTHWKDRCFNFLSCMEMFLISGTFKNVV